MTKILLIGDHIDDHYFFGKPLGLANEDPVIKFSPQEVKVTNGGVSYCADLYKSLGPSDIQVKTVRLSESSIYRYVDEGSQRTLFTVDHNRTDQKLTSDGRAMYTGEDLEFELNAYQPDFIHVWLDGDRVSWESKVLLLDKVQDYALMTQTLVALDSDNPSDLYNLGTKFSPDFLKTYDIDIFHDWTMNIGTICTSNSNQIQFLTERAPYGEFFSFPKVQHVVDSCGAGDTFFVAFICYLINIYGTTDAQLSHLPQITIDTALKYAQAAAVNTISNFGTFVPTKEEVLTVLPSIKLIRI